MNRPNPYEVLQLDPTASEAEIVQQAGRLKQRAADDDALTRIRQAVHALTSSEEQCRLDAMQTHAQPCHNWPAIERLANAHRRPPIDAAERPACPALDLDEVLSLLRPLVLRELQLREQVLELGEIEETDEEIDQQTVEALWQISPFLLA